ncbi:MAG: TonB-dependent receptor plug domain-containing protein, partial [Pseudomonadota bacterium]|nr:TonB-dependent receptor plug domain-containing protein [Pseudomonadota bacterium]
MKPRFALLLPAVFLACAPAAVFAADADGIETAAAEPTKLSPVTVEGQKEAGPTYSIDSASGATKTGTPLLETPQSIQVITRELIEDQDARILDDVLRNVAGVMPGGYYGDYDYFRIRGFDASGYTYLDGMPMSKGSVTNNKELFGLEKVEVVRGPAAVLYGAGSLGGLVNLVSKRPRDENFADLEISTGRYLDVEPAVDAGAVLGKGLSTRINALYRDEGSFTDFGERQRLFIAPSLSWQIADSTELTVLTSYTDNEDRLGFPLPAVGTV